MFNEQEQKRAKETKRAGLFRTLAFVFMFLLLAGSLAGIGAMLFDNSSPLDEAGRGTTADTLWAGSGTAASPWVISTVADLKQWGGSSSYWAAGTYTQLGADITWDGTNWNSYRVTNFAGNFDGKNHVIKNFYMSSTTSSTGFICTTSGTATIKNFGLVGGSVSGAGSVGGIVGSVSGTKTTIEYCFNTASITLTGGSDAGGILGTASSATIAYINYCFNTGNINLTSGSYVGGICGAYGTQQFCFNTGSVAASNHNGGITGRHGTVLDSYNVGNVGGGQGHSAGITGGSPANSTRVYNASEGSQRVQSSGTAPVNAYYNSNKGSSDMGGSCAGTAVTQSQMIDNTTLS